MTGMTRAVCRAGMVALVLKGILLVTAGRACATDLAINPALDIGGQGLSIRSKGTGLATTGSGSIEFSTLTGPVRQATLYWGGFHEPGEAPRDQLLVNGQLVTGVLVGSDQNGDKTWYAFRADVKAYFEGISGGVVQLVVTDPLFGMPGGLVNGASVILYFDDATNPLFYRARIAEGSQFIFGGAPDDDGLATPVVFQFDPAVVSRTASLSLVVGNADLSLRDRVDISDNEPLLDALTAADGQRWDSFTTSVLIPSFRSNTTVTVVSPEAFGNEADRLHVVAMAYRLLCGGQIGDFVWADQNGNGIQDPGEPGVGGIRLILEQFDDVLGDFVQVGETQSSGAGAYLFQGLCAGFFRVKADPSTFPDGVVPIAPMQGDDPTIDSDFVLEGDYYVAYVTLPDDGASNLDIDLGLAPGVTIFAGACCLPNGTCVEILQADCIAAGGTFAGIAIPCSSVEPCPQPNIACCLPSGECVEVTAAACAAQGGDAQPFPSVCADVQCPQPDIACCLPSGECVNVTAAACAAQGGAAQPFPSVCDDVQCPQPAVACCLPDGTCIEVPAAACSAQGGIPSSFPVLCGDIVCAAPTDPTLRVRAAEKGSVLYLSKVDVRWDKNGHVIRDTFISLTNDHPDDVRVLMYFVNGDEPLPAANGERFHPGWNFVDNAVTLTGNQPIYWSAATGAGTVGGLSPFFVLDPGMPPGRPVGDGTTDRMIRGFIVGFATNASGAPIRFNHLSGAATIIDYRQTSAWEYPAFAFRGIAGTHGAPIGVAGTLKLDGEDYATGYEQLLISFMATGSASLSAENRLVQALGKATIHPVDLDVRMNAYDGGPVTTRVMVDIWNENEVKFSGTSICVTCWNSTLLSAYASPNQFALDHLQTERGKARFRSTTGPACDDTAPHDLVSLLGLIEQELRFDGVVHLGQVERAGGPMFGMGLRSAVIRYDVEGLPPEAPADKVEREIRPLTENASAASVGVKEAVREGMSNDG
jgi:hypothetical protein